jgi:hypothetical protein
MVSPETADIFIARWGSHHNGKRREGMQTSEDPNNWVVVFTGEDCPLAALLQQFDGKNAVFLGKDQYTAVG